MKLAKYNHFDDVNLVIAPGEIYKTPYIFTENVPADYTDITSVANIDKHGFAMDDSFDYKRVRDIMKLYVESVGFGTLNDTEKKIAASHKIGTLAERVAAYNDNYTELDMAGEIYHTKVLEVRRNRITAAKSKIHNRLGGVMVGPYTAPEILLSEITEDVILMYENEGLGGVIDGDNSPGLMDYINETAGTPYVGVGLRSKTWIPYGYVDCSAMADKLLEILQDGIY